MNKTFLMAAVAAAALLSACGGGGGNNGETKVQISSVKVVGASLADSGTFGYKFTVQSATGTPYQVYSERIAATYGLGLCAHYVFGSSTGFTPQAACTNYAVAGAAINNYTAPTSPLSQLQQLRDVGATGFGRGDLLIVGEGSANDTATLLGAVSSPTNFQALMLTVLSPQVFGGAMTADPSGATAGVLYMQALADQLVAEIKASAIDKGATRIAVLNTLDVTKTPKFQAVLASLSAPQAAGITALAAAWVQAYNARLAANVLPYADKVVVVDFYKSFNDEIAAPAQYGLSNTTATVCDEVVNHGMTSLITAGTTALSNAPAVPLACNDFAASATTPRLNGGTTTWWQSYLYADNFHPTPYGHQLLAQLVAKRLTEAGWL